MSSTKNIALLYGGNSSEREVSLVTGKNVGEALIKLGYKVTFIDTKNKNDLITLVSNNFDIAFICLHGVGGEDGSIQGFLETINLSYTGSKVKASALAINKADTKTLYTMHNISNANYFIVDKLNLLDINKQLDITGKNVVVKAANGGSSIGLFFASGIDKIEKSIEKAFNYDDTVIVEQQIKGREFTCAVIDFPKSKITKYKNQLDFEGSVAALPVIEVLPKNEFYDYESKYAEGGSKHICPANLNKEESKKIQQIAISAHKCLKCDGYSRTDVIMDKAGNFYALETNTIPGMTSKSLVPDAARAIGISFEELCNLIVEKVCE